MQQINSKSILFVGQKNTGFMFIDVKSPTPIKDKQLLIKHFIFKFIINN